MFERLPQEVGWLKPIETLLEKVIFLPMFFWTYSRPSRKWACQLFLGYEFFLIYHPMPLLFNQMWLTHSLNPTSNLPHFCLTPFIMRRPGLGTYHAVNQRERQRYISHSMTAWFNKWAQVQATCVKNIYFKAAASLLIAYECVIAKGGFDNSIHGHLQYENIYMQTLERTADNTINNVQSSQQPLGLAFITNYNKSRKSWKYTAAQAASDGR